MSKTETRAATTNGRDSPASHSAKIDRVTVPPVGEQTVFDHEQVERAEGTTTRDIGGATPTEAGGATSDTGGATMRETFVYVLTADDRGKHLEFDEATKPPIQHPDNERARQINYRFKRGMKGQAPRDQLEFIDEAENIVHALNDLYSARDASKDTQFRLFYLRVFGLARLVLQDGVLGADTGRAELARIERDLIQDEGPTVKGRRITALVVKAAILSGPVLLLYVGLSLVPSSGSIYRFLGHLHVDPATAASFMLVWLGCFLGVCLSFTLRKHDFKLDDLVATTEPDFLRPVPRLLFAGTLTMLLVMLSMLDMIDVKFGTLALSRVTGPHAHMLAFVVGAICGISELLLPTKIMGQKNLLSGT